MLRGADGRRRERRRWVAVRPPVAAVQARRGGAAVGVRGAGARWRRSSVCVGAWAAGALGKWWFCWSFEPSRAGRSLLRIVVRRAGGRNPGACGLPRAPRAPRALVPETRLPAARRRRAR